MESDAEWFDVDLEFGPPSPRTTPRPKPGPRTFPREPRPPTIAPPPPHEEHDQAMPEPVLDYTSITAGVVSGVLGIVLILLIVYLVFLRKRLTKVEASHGSLRGSARGGSTATTDDDYRIRVDDIAHLSNLDETSNTYVNTTDLQRLVISVTAKKKAQEKPLPSAPGCSDGPARVVVRPPMVPPKSETSLSSPRLPPWLDNTSEASGDHSSVSKTNTPAPTISNITKPVISAPKLISSSADLPKLPVPPKKGQTSSGFSTHPTTSDYHSEDPYAIYENDVTISPKNIHVANSGIPRTSPSAVEPTSPTVARPAPPPPVGAVRGGSPPHSDVQMPAKIQVPPPIPTAPKPIRPQPPTLPKPNIKPYYESSAQLDAKPTPPSLPKPKGLRRGNPGLPPLKMALLPSSNIDSSDYCETPDTAIIELTPSGSPTNTLDAPLAAGGASGSIGARIALLEGKMKTPALPSRGQHH